MSNTLRLTNKRFVAWKRQIRTLNWSKVVGNEEGEGAGERVNGKG